MNNQNKKKFNIWLVLTIIFLMLAIGCIGYFIKTMIDNKNRADDMSNLLVSTPISSEASVASEESSESEPINSSVDVEISSEVETTQELVDPFEDSVNKIKEAGIPIPDLNVDIPALQESTNPHIYAWIYIPGTKVNYPVLQHPSDDAYYLNYNIDGTKGYPGCIYSEKTYNEKTFSDANTVLYGHNMKNGTMFGSLHKYEDEDFFYENRYIYVYTEERLLVYKIFAAYEHSNEHLLYNHSFDNAMIFYQYFEKVKAERNMHRIFDEDVELTGEGQHIITLSTCINNQPNKRYLVQGVLINEE